MATIRIYSPVGKQPVQDAVALNPFPAYGPLTIGVLENTKPNARLLMSRIAGHVAARFPEAEIKIERKYSAAAGASEAIFHRLNSVDLVFTGSGD